MKEALDVFGKKRALRSNRLASNFCDATKKEFERGEFPSSTAAESPKDPAVRKEDPKHKRAMCSGLFKLRPSNLGANV